MDDRDTDGFHNLDFGRDGDVLVVTIDRPDSDLNAVDDRLHHELSRLFRRLQAEREARAVLLCGTETAFSAGGDFAWFPELQEPGRLADLRLDAKSLIWDLLDVHLPVVCALTGHAMGLGASVALLCDVVVMAETARLGDPHVKVGIVAGDGGTIAWPLAVGPMLAKRYLLTGDPVDASEALRLGLVAETAPRRRVLPESRPGLGPPVSGRRPAGRAVHQTGRQRLDQGNGRYDVRLGRGARDRHLRH